MPIAVRLPGIPEFPNPRGNHFARRAMTIKPRAVLGHLEAFLDQIHLLDRLELFERFPVRRERRLRLLIDPGPVHLLRPKGRPLVPVVPGLSARSRLPFPLSLSPGWSRSWWRLDDVAGGRLRGSRRILPRSGQLLFQLGNPRQRGGKLLFPLRHPFGQPSAVPTFPASHPHDATIYPTTRKLTYSTSGTRERPLKTFIAYPPLLLLRMRLASRRPSGARSFPASPR